MAHHEERAAPAGRPPQKMVRLAAEPFKHSPRRARPQRSRPKAQHLPTAADALASCRKAHREALALGGKHGSDLDALAIWFARRARTLAAGGAA